jgi:hypothetical protein
MVIALQGCRTDSPDAKRQRFPHENVEIVRMRIGAVLEAHSTSVLVSSAACGGDLLALSVAWELGIRRRIVLPFDRERFRALSVADRPGDWERLYDQMLDRAGNEGDLLVIQGIPDIEAYAKASRMILDEALSLGLRLHKEVTAVLVWGGKDRGEGDLMTDFRMRACEKGLPIIEVMTVDHFSETVESGG